MCPTSDLYSSPRFNRDSYKSEYRRTQDWADTLSAVIIKQAVEDYYHAKSKIQRYDWYFRQMWWRTTNPKKIPVQSVKMAFDTYQKKLKHYPKNKKLTDEECYRRWKGFILKDYDRCQKTIQECRYFIGRSEWFKILSDLDGKQLLKDIDRLGIKEDLMEYDTNSA